MQSLSFYTSLCLLLSILLWPLKFPIWEFNLQKPTNASRRCTSQTLSTQFGLRRFIFQRRAFCYLMDILAHGCKLGSSLHIAKRPMRAPNTLRRFCSFSEGLVWTLETAAGPRCHHCILHFDIRWLRSGCAGSLRSTSINICGKLSKRYQMKAIPLSTQSLTPDHEIRG